MEFQLDVLGFTTAYVVGKGTDLLLSTGCRCGLDVWEKSVVYYFAEGFKDKGPRWIGVKEWALSSSLAERHLYQQPSCQPYDRNKEALDDACMMQTCQHSV